MISYKNTYFNLWLTYLFKDSIYINALILFIYLKHSIIQRRIWEMSIYSKISKENLSEMLLTAVNILGIFDMDEIKNLIAAGADVNCLYNSFIEHDESAFSRSLQTNNVELVELLLKNGANPNWAGGFQNAETALSRALRLHRSNANPKIASLLVDFGADIRHVDQFGYTPLMQAATYNKIIILATLIDALKSRGFASDINHVDNYGYTALMRAAEKDATQAAKLLIKNGADVNLATGSGATPLMQAVWLRNLPLASILIQNGADVDAEMHRVLTMGTLQEQAHFYERLFSKMNKAGINHDDISANLDTSELKVIKQGGDIIIEDPERPGVLKIVGKLEVCELKEISNAHIDFGITALTLASTIINPEGVIISEKIAMIKLLLGAGANTASVLRISNEDILDLAKKHFNSDLEYLEVNTELTRQVYPTLFVGDLLIAANIMRFEAAPVAYILEHNQNVSAAILALEKISHHENLKATIADLNIQIQAAELCLSGLDTTIAYYNLDQICS